MATSYANTGGSGDRTAIITLSHSGVIAGTASVFIDGSTSGTGAWLNATALSGSVYIRFDFATSKVIDEAKYYQQDGTAQGTWKWQGSADAAAWTDIGSSFALGGTTSQTITALSGNTAGYRYYQIVGVSGSSDANPWVYEAFEFKIDDFVGGGTTPKGPLSNPFSGPFGGPVG